MEITFTRDSERSYSMVAIRDDKVTVKVPGFDHPTGLPHDMIHYVVEHTLGMQQGFWGRVAAGAIFPGMAVLDGRQPPHAAAKSMEARKEAPETGTESEALAWFFSEITRQRLENDWPRVQKMLRKGVLSARSAALSLGQNDVKRVCGELRNMEQQWQDLGVGESLTVTWPSQKNRKR